MLQLAYIASYTIWVTYFQTFFSGVFNINVLSSLWRALTSESLGTESAQLKDVLHHLDATLEEQSRSKWIVVLDYYWITWILKKLNLIALGTCNDKIIDYIQPTIEEHR